MVDESIELRWRRLGYVVEDEPKARRKRRGRGQLRPRLTRDGDRASGSGVGDVPNSRRRAVAVEPAAGADSESPLADKLAKKRPATAGGGATGAGGSAGTGPVVLADRRQRCIVKVNYVRHGAAGGRRGGGAAPLRAHDDDEAIRPHKLKAARQGKPLLPEKGRDVSQIPPGRQPPADPGGSKPEPPVGIPSTGPEAGPSGTEEAAPWPCAYLQ